MNRKCKKLVERELMKYLYEVNIKYTDIICWKKESYFCIAKVPSFLKKIYSISISYGMNFNVSLTYDVICMNNWALNIF